MYFDWDYAGAEAEFKRAVAINPGNASVHMWYGWFLGLMGRFDESLGELNRAREVDPLSAPNINAIGVVLYWSGQTDRAIAQFEDVLELHPNYPVAIAFLAEAYVQKGDLASAVATIEKLASDAMDPQALSVLGYVYARSGDREKAVQVLDTFKDLSGQGYSPAINYAHIYAGLGDHEKAFKWLANACDKRVTWVPFMRVDPKFDVLRSERRFDEMLGRAGFGV
jgi:Flp pilus assembly protein TadD